MSNNETDASKHSTLDGAHSPRWGVPGDGYVALRGKVEAHRVCIGCVGQHALVHDGPLAGRIVKILASAFGGFMSQGGTGLERSTVSPINPPFAVGDMLYDIERNVYGTVSSLTFTGKPVLADEGSGEEAARRMAVYWLKVPTAAPVNPTAPVEDAPVKDGLLLPTGEPVVNGHTAQEWSDRWDALWEALAEKADDQNWCSEYDDFAEEQGGPERLHEYEVTLTLDVIITGADADKALAEVLGGNGKEPDCEGFTVKNRVRISITCSSTDLADTTQRADRLIREALAEDSWEFNDYDIEYYDRA